VAGAPAGFQAGITPWNYLLAQGAVIIRYLRLLVVPYGFTVDPDVRVPPLWLCLLAWLAVAAFLVIVWRYAGKQVATFTLAAWCWLLPSSSSFPRRTWRPIAHVPSDAGLRRGTRDSLARLRPALIAILAVGHAPRG